MKKIVRIGLTSTVLLGVIFPAHAALITFNELTHGTVVDDQYLASQGLTISAENTGGGPDIAIIFDSSTANSIDPDLVGPSASTWSGGNLAPGTNLGNLLIIAENDIDRNEDGLIDNPDDEGNRPAGNLFFEFNSPITEFGFDLVDVELAETGKDRGYVTTFYLGSDQLASVKFSDYIDPLSEYYDPTVAFGNNTANHLAPIKAANLGLLSFDKVAVNFGGSAGIDNIYWDRPGTNVEVSEPATPWMVTVGLGLLLSVFYLYRGRREDEDN
tara:strand:- start:44975 stop:45787 length:813 start_codon:yes stop_codon:yes gene_type:complete